MIKYNLVTYLHYFLVQKFSINSIDINEIYLIIKYKK